ncbi:MAG TPA: SEC-C metal-binding domain-containing protein, partial [Marmoricola sp.]|nr:SEC-C metal-binding domain-containing protein [Marmoricola sp.]
DVMSRQREVIYGERRNVLEGADLREHIREMVNDAVSSNVLAATEGYPEEWDLEALWTALKVLYPVSLSHSELEQEAGGRDGLHRQDLVDALVDDAQQAYERREDEVGVEVIRELERQVMLSVLDRKWREHLYEMDYLREGIGLRAYSQRDPLVEYQKEGFDMFNAMKEGIREDTVGFLFNLQVQVEQSEYDEDDLAGAVQVQEHPIVHAKGLGQPTTPTNLTYSAPSEDGEAEVTGSVTTVTNADDPFANVGRNQKCPCGSGKKFKQCHGAAGPTGLTTRAGG